MSSNYFPYNKVNYENEYSSENSQQPSQTRIHFYTGISTNPYKIKRQMWHNSTSYCKGIAKDPFASKMCDLAYQSSNMTLCIYLGFSVYKNKNFKCYFSVQCTRFLVYSGLRYTHNFTICHPNRKYVFPRESPKRQKVP